MQYIEEVDRMQLYMFLELNEEKLNSWEDMKDEEILSLSQAKPDAFGVLCERYETLFVRKPEKSFEANKMQKT